MAAESCSRFGDNSSLFSTLLSPCGIHQALKLLVHEKQPVVKSPVNTTNSCTKSPVSEFSRKDCILKLSDVQWPVVVQRAHSVVLLQTLSYEYETFLHMDLEQENFYVQKLIVIKISSIMVNISICKVLLNRSFHSGRTTKLQNS